MNGEKSQRAPGRNGVAIFERHKEALRSYIQSLENLDLRDASLGMIYVAAKSPEWAWEMTYCLNRLAAYFRERIGGDQEVWSAIYRETAAILGEYRETEV